MVARFMLRRILFPFCLLVLLLPSPSRASNEFSFLGEADPKTSYLTLIFPDKDSKGQSIVFNKIQDDTYQITVDLNQFKLMAFEMTAHLEVNLKVQRKQDKTIHALIGTIHSRYTLVNKRPIQDIKGQFAVTDGTLKIHSLSAGNTFLRGDVQLTKPFKLNLALQLFDIDMEDFLEFFNGHRRIEANGSVDGVVKISGTMDKVDLKGDLFSYDAYVDKLSYHSILLKAKGTFPVIELADTVIIQSDGLPFNVSGTINLLDKDNFKKQIAALSRKPVIIDDSHNVEWTFRRIEDNNESASTELKYLRRKNGGVHSLPEEQGDMLGIERTLEF